MRIEDPTQIDHLKGEKRKRKREWVFSTLLVVLFLVLTWVEIRLFETSSQLPFVHSIFFFGLVNFNIILFLLLFFLIFRNVVKNFSETQRGLTGRSLKGKMIAAFVGFSFVPTALMFLVSVFYINNSFDKWFSEKMTGVLKNSIEVTNAYHLSAKKRNYHFAKLISKEIRSRDSVHLLESKLKTLLVKYNVDAIEYYRGLVGSRVAVTNEIEALKGIPEVSLEFKKNGVIDRSESSTVQHFGEGNLIRVIVPVDAVNRSALVVSTFVPLSLLSRMDDIAATYEEVRNVDPLSYPLKSIYLIILVLMTLVILLGATWFGFYLAKQLTVPLEKLGIAARRVAEGEYEELHLQTHSPEIKTLISDFNTMTRALFTSENNLKQTNENLQGTLSQLYQRTKYLEIILKTATTGVIAANEHGIVTMVNQHAENLLGIRADQLIGKNIESVLSKEYSDLFHELMQSMKDHSTQSIQRELRVALKKQQIYLQFTLSVLLDDRGNEIGKLLVFNDLTPIIGAQRAAAWKEVARRIAHEIKNPLTPIRLSAQRLQRKYGEQIKDLAFAESTKMIIDQVDDLKMLVNEFSQFARMPQANPAFTDLNAVIKDSILLFQSAHRHVNFDFKGDSELQPFLLDPALIKRMMNNLIDNAIEALEGVSGPKVEIKTNLNAKLKIVRIEVIDNGKGISREILSRVFEPYVTSKRDGTGLGLAIVKRTVEDHNGFVRAFSELGRGTRFLIELPYMTVASDKEIRFKQNEEMDRGENEIS